MGLDLMLDESMCDGYKFHSPSETRLDSSRYQASRIDVGTAMDVVREYRGSKGYGECALPLECHRHPFHRVLLKAIETTNAMSSHVRPRQLFLV